MICNSNEFEGINEHDKHWTNWNEDINFTDEEYFEPTHTLPENALNGLSHLVHVVDRATKEQKHLKAVGSGWSYEDIARSDSWRVSLRQLTRRLQYVISGKDTTALNDDWKQRHFNQEGHQRLVHVEAGIEIGALSVVLEADGMAMYTLGGKNGQSIAGAISTSTHGGDWEQPPLPDFVRAIHLVTEGGRELWIEPFSAPITQNDRLKLVLPCANTEIIRDDNIFKSVLVSCGRFGVIYAFVIEVRTAFRVVEVTTKTNPLNLIEALRAGIGTDKLYDPFFNVLRDLPHPPSLKEGSGIISTDNPSFFQLIFNPLNPEDCWVQRRWETSELEDLPKPDMVVKGEVDGTGIFLLAEVALQAIIPLALLIPIVGPFYAFAISLAATEMSIHALGKKMTLGEATELILNALWKLPFGGNVVKDIAYKVIAGNFEQSITTGKRGSHHVITSGTPAESHNIEFRADAIEIIFDAATETYIDFLNTILEASPRFRQCGYISLRPSRSSKAVLSMHNIASPQAVSIEITTIKGLPDNIAWMEYIQRAALFCGGRPHWGQYNKLNELQVISLYGKDLMSWREALLRVSQESTTFSNHFTRQRGLEPLNILREIVSVRRTEQGVTTHLCGPVGSEWSPISVKDVIHQISAGIAQYFTHVHDKVAFLDVIDNEYLRTRPDTMLDNNLDNLPECTDASLPK